MRRLLITLCASSLFGCSQPKNVFDYYAEANKFIQANEIAKAEEILKEGILKNSDAGLLKMELFRLYMKTNIDTAEKYVAVVSMEPKYLADIYSDLAREHFNSKRFDKAYKYYILQGDTEIYASDKDEYKCLKLAVSSEAYRNGAASASNLGDRGRVREAFQKMTEKKPGYEECADKEDSKYVAEVRQWLR